MKDIDETLVGFIKQNTQQGRNEKQRERTKSKSKAQKPKVGHKWAKEQIMFQNPR